jgi:hypothetical protein
VSNRRDPREVFLEAEGIVQRLEELQARLPRALGPFLEDLKRAQAFIYEGYPDPASSAAGAEYFVGVKDGRELIQSVGDSVGDCKAVELYTTPEEACSRFFNVRRARLILDTEPVRAPESWGAIDE